MADQNSKNYSDFNKNWYRGVFEVAESEYIAIFSKFKISNEADRVWKKYSEFNKNWYLRLFEVAESEFNATFKKSRWRLQNGGSKLEEYLIPIKIRILVFLRLPNPNVKLDFWNWRWRTYMAVQNLWKYL